MSPRQKDTETWPQEWNDSLQKRGRNCGALWTLALYCLPPWSTGCWAHVPRAEEERHSRKEQSFGLRKTQAQIWLLPFRTHVTLYTLMSTLCLGILSLKGQEHFLTNYSWGVNESVPFFFKSSPNVPKHPQMLGGKAGNGRKARGVFLKNYPERFFSLVQCHIKLHMPDQASVRGVGDRKERPLFLPPLLPHLALNVIFSNTVSCLQPWSPSDPGWNLSCIRNTLSKPTNVRNRHNLAYDKS